MTLFVVLESNSSISAQQAVDGNHLYLRTFIDHGGQSRPGETSGLRDKGADEVD